MVQVLEWVLTALVIITIIGSSVFSYRSRRAANIQLRGLYAAKMNINLGLMLIFIALMQMFMFSGSSVRVVVGAVFMLLGLFNLFAGVRNHSHFKRT